MLARAAIVRSSIVLVILAVMLYAALPASAVSPPQSTFFATATEESYSTYQLPGDGDLWPSCWADDDNLYAANGDGTAFTNARRLGVFGRE